MKDLLHYMVMEIHEGEVLGRGSHPFTVTPRKGEFIEYSPGEIDSSREDEWARIWEVAAVIHSNEGDKDAAGDIYVRDRGLTVDFLKTLVPA